MSEVRVEIDRWLHFIQLYVRTYVQQLFWSLYYHPMVSTSLFILQLLLPALPAAAAAAAVSLALEDSAVRSYKVTSVKLT